MRVLVIEDDRELAETIGIGLRREQLAVDVAFDGQAGLERALVTGYVVIVLDRDRDPGSSAAAVRLQRTLREPGACLKGTGSASPKGCHPPGEEGPRCGCS